MATRLYIGGLPYSTTEDELKNLFSQAGSVQSVRIITDKLTGKSRGFGFVEMSNAEEAKNATRTLNGTSLGDRSITVNEARPPQERPQGGGGPGGGNRRPGGPRRW
ncbi:MAG: RNA-binding protein [Nitrospirae bacterium]|nr:RNA-binding protein [Nitrospirota bacterium]